MPQAQPVAASSSAEPKDHAPRKPAVDRASQAERAYQSLKRLILDGELPAGAQVLELEAAAQLGMSRTPVREAMVRLEHEGIVEIRPRHGMRVLPVAATDMRDIYAVLTALEASAAEEVARRGLPPTELAVLRAAVAEMDAALAADDLRRWAAADECFHASLVAACGNRRLSGLVAQLHDQAHRARMLTLHLRPKPVDSNRDHAALVEAIAARDAERARQIHHAHRQRAGAMLADLIERLGLQQI